MRLPDVIARSTVAPAQAIRRPELGTLSPGVVADVAVLELQRGAFSFRDCGYARIDADQKLECVLTLREGQIIYERDGLALPHWRDAPDPYWRIPELQVGSIERNWRPLL
jgi:dihydroorotase